MQNMILVEEKVVFSGWRYTNITISLNIYLYEVSEMAGNDISEPVLI